MRRILQSFFAVAIGLTATGNILGATYTVDFESQQAGVTTIVTAPHLVISGGKVVLNSYMWQHLAGKQYASYSCPWCTPCPNCGDIVLRFDAPADNVVFTFVHNQGDSWWFTFTDDQNRSVTTNFGCVSGCVPAGYTNPARYRWPYNGIRTLRISGNYILPNAPNTVKSFAIDDLSYTMAPQLAIVARLGNDPDAVSPTDPMPDPVPVSPNMPVKIPFGRTFSIRLKQKGTDGKWVDVPSSFALSAPHVSDTPADPTQTLFAVRAMFSYDVQPNLATTLFQSVHIGTGTLTITPRDSILPHVTLAVSSVVPAGLGAGATTFDQYFIGQGSIRGIPPQYLKAIAYNESGTLNRHEWRYEPRADLDHVVPNRSHDFFQGYRLATPPSDGGFSAGGLLCPRGLNAGCGFSDLDDLHAATTLQYRRGRTYNYIPGDRFDAFITIREICDGDAENDVSQNWHEQVPPACPPYTPLPPLNPPAPQPVNGIPRIVPHVPDPWLAIANPAEASSYGIMQTTWYSVIDDRIWQGVNAEGGGGFRQNPSLLFDDPVNISRGSASLIMGPAEYRYLFANDNNIDYAWTPDYDRPADFEQAHFFALRRYNGSTAYATRVQSDVPRYLPTLAAGTHIASGGCASVPVMYGEASSGTIVPGGHIDITAAITGATHYQWYIGAEGNTSSPIDDSNSDQIEVSPQVSTSYWVSASNDCGSISQSTTIAVGLDCVVPEISFVSNDAVIVSGASVTLTVTANGAATYQWYEVPSGGTPSIIAGASGQSISVSPSSNNSYFATVANDCDIINSRRIHVWLTACSAPLISAPPVDSTIYAGAAATLSLTAASPAPYDVKWFTAGGSFVESGSTISVAPTSTTSFFAIVENACGSVRSANVTVTVAPPCSAPVIVTPPVGGSIFAGHTATLSLVAMGGQPLAVQWFTSLGAALGTTATITVSPAETTDYYATVGNACGSVSTQVVTVHVIPCAAPTILLQPALQLVLYGQTAMLQVAAAGDPMPSTQWFTSGGDSVGTGISIWVTPLQTATYYAVVSNECGSVRTSDVVVQVCRPPAITTKPLDTTIIVGDSTELRVVATSGTPFTYQWYQGAAGDTSNAIAGATIDRVTVSPTQTTSYWVLLSNEFCETQSSTATVTVCYPPSAIAVSGGGSLIVGHSTTLFGIATGTGLIYQWYIGAAGDTSTPIFNGAQSITVTPQNLTNYWVRVTGACGTRDSPTVTVNVCAVPTINSQPQGVSIFSGSTATLSVAATAGTTTPLTYQWYVGTSGTMTSPISGATSSSFSTPALTADTSYWVAVSADICEPALSNAATVSICPFGPSTTGAPNQSISIGQTARLTMPFSPATGNTFFWYQGASGDTSHPLGDYGGDWGPYNYLDVSPAVTTQYWAQVKNGTCVTATTTTTVSVCIPTITQQPAGLLINAGQSTTLTVAANTTGLTYQWYRGASGDSSAPVGGNSPTFTTPALTTTTSYWVRVTGNCGQSVSSDTATVTICQPPSITVQPAGTSLVRGQSTTLGISATGTNLSYQWYLGTNGNTSSPVGGNSNLLTVTAPQSPVDYWVKITGTCGSAANSATAHISVCTTPAINIQPQSSYVFSGSSATLSVSASEAAGEPMHYQWHRGLSSPVNVGTDSPAYNTGAVSADTSYYVTVTAGLCSADSAAATVSICMYPQSVPGAPNANTSPGQSVRLQLGSNPGVTAYLWYRGASGDTSNPIGGWQAANYVDVAPITTTNYWAQWQANSGSCISNTTTTTVSVCIPVIMQQPANATISSGSTTLSVVSNLPGSTYQWYIGASGTTTSPISGATTASVTVSPGATTTYWCKVAGSCGVTNSTAATVTICSPPVITRQPVSSSSYPNNPNSLSVTATGTNLTYQWYYGVSGDMSNPFSGRTTSDLSLNPVSSTQYWVRVTGSCGSVNSAAAWMSVTPVIFQQPQQTTYLAQGSKGNLSVNATGTGLHYQWFGDSGPVIGAPDSPSLITPDINATASFYCIITSSGGAQTTSWTGTLYLCNGVTIYSTTVTNPGGNCRYLISNVGGSYDTISWYQGQRGNTSVQVGSTSYLYVCPSTSTTYWFRVTNTDQNQQVSCYADSAATTVP